MDEARRYVVRPFRPARSDLQESFKVYLSPASIHRHGFCAGDMCQLRTADGRSLPAILWPAVEKIQDSIVLITKVLQDLFRLSLGEHICILPSGASKIDAKNILLSDITTIAPKSPSPTLDQAQQAGWSWLLQCELKRTGILCPGLIISAQAGGEQRSFEILTINEKHDLGLYCSSVDTVVTISSDDSTKAGSQSVWTGSLELKTSDIGGLDAQIQFLNQLLLMYGTFADRFKDHALHEPRRGKVILHGPHGTGKSMILRKLSGSGWRKVLHLDVFDEEGPGNVRASIRRIFTDAKRYQPSMITIDNLEIIAAKKGPGDDPFPTSTAISLGKEIDRLGDSLVFVIAATENLTVIDMSLRSPQRFSREIAIPAPTESARYDILKLICGMPKDASDERLESLAHHTYGYTGSDLEQVIRDARTNAMSGHLECGRGVNKDEGNLESQGGLSRLVTEEILTAARMQGQPTIMKEIFLDVPKVKWTDIGGQTEMKMNLQMAIEWPSKV